MFKFWGRESFMKLSTNLIAIISALCIAVSTIVYLFVVPTAFEFFWASLGGLLLAEVILFGPLLFINNAKGDNSLFFVAGATSAAFICSAVLFATSLLFIPAHAAALGVFLSIALVDLLAEAILLLVFYFVGKRFQDEDAKDTSKGLNELSKLEQNSTQISQSRRGGI